MDVLKNLLINHLLDMIIVVITLTTIICSLFKPTFRLVRWIVACSIAFIITCAIKFINFFNFLEVGFTKVLFRLKLDVIIDKVLNLVGKGNLSDAKVDSITNIAVLVILFALTFIIIDVIMLVSHKVKLHKAKKEGHYIYPKPVISLLLSVGLVVAVIFVGTFALHLLPIQTDYIQGSYILRHVDAFMTRCVNFVGRRVPRIGSMDHLVSVLKNSIGC